MPVIRSKPPPQNKNKRFEGTIDPLTFKILVAIGIIVVATIHGFGAAWLAIWMLFHPYNSVKLFGLTIWPQGMIPRHREKLAQSIGNAVGNELVSQQTVFDALFETSFFQRKVEDFVGDNSDKPRAPERLISASRGKYAGASGRSAVMRETNCSFVIGFNA